MNRLMVMAMALVLSGAQAATAGGDSHGTAAQEEGAAAAGGGTMMDGEQMTGPMMLLPIMDSENGRRVYAEKGCAVCHSVNGVGGEDAPPLDAETMPLPMNPFDFAARMWRGAAAMIVLQEDELGGQIEITGRELADLIAFMHDPDEQDKFSLDDIPGNIKELMPHDD